jgi:hypothetical protein
MLLRLGCGSRRRRVTRRRADGSPARAPRRYLELFWRTVLTLDGPQMEADLQRRGATFALIALPSALPAGVLFAYTMWIGLKVFIHSPSS